MTVFKTAITSLVISSVAFASQSAHALWAYRVDAPQPPHFTTTKYLTNPTVAQIQNAIKPKTRVIVIGNVDASNGDTLHVDVDDVRLSFYRANQINWHGGDNWEGFVEISGHRVQVFNLRLNVEGSGRCRGVTINTPASDVRIGNCEFQNTADGLVADGEWERLAVINSKFLNCTNWSDNSMPGGYGMFLEDDDWNDDHLWLNNVTITLSNGSYQHGLRISQVQHALIENCDIGANQKRSFWAYGVSHMAVRSSTFRNGSMLFNLMADEHYTDREVRHVRVDSCRIEHTGILQPIDVYCGRGTRDLQIRDCDITSSSSPQWIMVGWRTESPSQYILWHDGTITFNGNPVRGRQWSSSSDWTMSEQNQLKIGPMTVQ